KIAVAANELWNSRRQSQHVLKHEDLAIAGDARADADGRDRNLLGDPPPKRLGDRLDHHRKCTGVGHGPGVSLDRLPVRLVTALSAERADGIDRLRREADMTH